MFEWNVWAPEFILKQVPHCFPCRLRSSLWWALNVGISRGYIAQCLRQDHRSGQSKNQAVWICISKSSFEMKPSSPPQDLATAGATKRPTCCVLVMTKPAKGELAQEEQEKLKSDYSQVATEVKELASSLY